MKKYLLLLFISGILISCNNSHYLKTENDFVSITVNPDDAIKHEFASNLYSAIDYVPLESSDDCLIGEITQLLYHKDQFFILDENVTQSIYCFNSKGTFLFKINDRGLGPHEYINVGNISIDYDNQYLLVHCVTSKKILVYDLNGNYLKSHRLGFSATRFSYIGNGYSAFFCDFGTNSNLQRNNLMPNLIITDDRYKIVGMALPFPAKRNPGAISMISNCFTSFNENFTSTVIPYNDTVYQISQATIKEKYLIDFHDHKDKNFRDMLYSPTTQISDVIKYVQQFEICTILSFLETSKNIFFTYNQNNSYHFVFTNKNTIKDIVIHQNPDKEFKFPITNDIDGGPFPIPFFADEIKFYSIVQPFELITVKEKILHSNAPGKKDLLNIINKITMTDNPVIAILTPK